LNPDRTAIITRKIGPIYKLVEGKYWIDEFYFGKLINPLVNLSKGLWVYIDVRFIDQITYWVSDFISSAGRGIRSLQNGNLQQYALFIAIGLISLMIYSL
jgi:NADH-quinone oxidoreductase subunit L